MYNYSNDISAAFDVIEVDKSLIVAGDCIVHNGKESTVCCKDITRDTFLGVKLFGDCYRLGAKKVKKMILKNKESQ